MNKQIPVNPIKMNNRELQLRRILVYTYTNKFMDKSESNLHINPLINLKIWIERTPWRFDKKCRLLSKI